MQGNPPDSDDPLRLPTCGGEGHPAHEHQRYSDQTLAAAARIGAALGDVGRLRLLESLAGGPHCVSELAAESGDSLPATSQRLRVLLDAGLVTRAREGRHVHYRLADVHVSRIVDQIFLHGSEAPPDPS
jgi:ArsR family transcriptional regulator